MMTDVRRLAYIFSIQTHHDVAKRIEQILCENLHLLREETIELLAESKNEGEKAIVKIKDGVRKLWIRRFGNQIELLVQFGNDDKTSMVDEFLLFSEHINSAKRLEIPIVLNFPCGRKIPAHFPSGDECETVSVYEKNQEG
ncbi:MAG: hypothetical protein WCW78_03220 [Candidatus Paceibacterota bacterium]|jgi:hypothetical protein